MSTTAEQTPSPSPSTPAPPPEASGTFWGIVEIMGHRQMAGRCQEARQFGAEGILIEVPHGEGYLPPQWYAGTSLFAVHRVSEPAAREAAKGWQVQQFARTLLGPAALPPAEEEEEDDDPDLADILLDEQGQPLPG